MTNNLVPIREFRGMFWFLSNFYPSDVEYEGLTYPTVEHAFQAAKFARPEDRAPLTKPSLPASLAKREAQKAELPATWDATALQLMEALLRSKFSKQNMRALLDMTKGKELFNSNQHNEVYWGVCGSAGENWLGRLLMKIRDEPEPKPAFAARPVPVHEEVSEDSEELE